jgi:hypothetical protein
MRRESFLASSAGETATAGSSVGPAAGWARDPEDHGSRDQEEEPRAAVQRQADAGEEDGSCDRQQAEADQRPGTVTPLAERGSCDRVVLALVGHDERGGGVDQDASSAEQGEDDEADTEDGGWISKYWARPPLTPATLRFERLRCRRRISGYVWLSSCQENGLPAPPRPSGMTLRRP